MGSDSTAKAGATAAAGTWTTGHGINTHKLLAAPVIATLMWTYSCFTSAAWTYLALHGVYGLLWVAKDFIFPDKKFKEPCSFGSMLFVFVFISVAYFSTPWVLVYHAKSVPEWYLSVAIAVFSIGMFLMIGSDCQKYYTLKAAPGKLITAGFFKHVRSPNFLGEILIYTSFSMLTFTPWGFGSTMVLLLATVKTMKEKDRSMSRYPEFADYKASTSSMVPLFF